MLWQPSLSAKYQQLSEVELADAIGARKAELGDDLLILGHHYQQDEVIQHADLTGDSLKLSQLAAEQAVKRGTKTIVFCGVHFMAETADMLTPDDIAVVLPDLSAGCSMADMAEYDDVVTAWDELHEGFPKDRNIRVIPVTYVNSSAAVKAFVGDHGGACCTSSNAAQIFRWALNGGTQPKADDEDIRLLFLPDQHLGRNTAKAYGFYTDVDAHDASNGRTPETNVWNPKQDFGGLTDQQICDTKVFLWAGHCSVHKLFRPEHVDEARAAFDDVTVLVHPECAQDVVDMADLTGSTEFIIRTIENAKPGTHWFIGTEVHLVNRLANEAKQRGVDVHMLSECQCLCTTMFRIDQSHLLWALDELAAGRIANQIRVSQQTRESARLALQRMLSHVAPAQSPSELTHDEPQLVD